MEMKPTENDDDKIQNAKKELREYRDSIKYIEEKQNDAEELRTRIEKTTKTIKSTPSGKGYDPDKAPFEESLDKIQEIEKDCYKKLQELLLKKYSVENKIEQLEQPYKSILYLKYIRGINLYDISRDLGYSYRHTKRVHQEAIEKYANL